MRVKLAVFILIINSVTVGVCKPQNTPKVVASQFNVRLDEALIFEQADIQDGWYVDFWTGNYSKTVPQETKPVIILNRAIQENLNKNQDKYLGPESLKNAPNNVRDLLGLKDDLADSSGAGFLAESLKVGLFKNSISSSDKQQAWFIPSSASWNFYIESDNSIRLHRSGDEDKKEPDIVFESWSQVVDVLGKGTFVYSLAEVRDRQFNKTQELRLDGDRPEDFPTKKGEGTLYYPADSVKDMSTTQAILVIQDGDQPAANYFLIPYNNGGDFDIANFAFKIDGDLRRQEVPGEVFERMLDRAYVAESQVNSQFNSQLKQKTSDLLVNRVHFPPLENLKSDANLTKLRQERRKLLRITNSWQQHFFEKDGNPTAPNEYAKLDVPGNPQIEFHYDKNVSTYSPTVSSTGDPVDLERRKLNDQFHWVPKKLEWSYLPHTVFYLDNGVDAIKYIQATEMPSHTWAAMQSNEDGLVKKFPKDQLSNGEDVEDIDSTQSTSLEKSIALLAQRIVVVLNAVDNDDVVEEFSNKDKTYPSAEDKYYTSILKSFKGSSTAPAVDQNPPPKYIQGNAENYSSLLKHQVSHYFLQRLLAAHHAKGSTPIVDNAHPFLVTADKFVSGFVPANAGYNSNHFGSFYLQDLSQNKDVPDIRVEPAVFLSAKFVSEEIKTIEKKFEAKYLDSNSDPLKFVVRLPRLVEAKQIEKSKPQQTSYRVWSFRQKPLTVGDSPFVSEWVFDKGNYFVVGCNRRSGNSVELNQGLMGKGRFGSPVISFRFVLSLENSENEANAAGEAGRIATMSSSNGYYNSIFGKATALDSPDSDNADSRLRSVSEFLGDNDYWKYEYLRAVMFAGYWDAKDEKDVTDTNPRIPWDELSDKELKEKLEMLLKED